MRILGIDPGLTGAIAVILPDGTIDFNDMPILEIKKRTQDIRVSRGTITLPQGIKTDLIWATIIDGDDIAGYEPAQDVVLYEYFLSDDQGDREASRNG